MNILNEIIKFTSSNKRWTRTSGTFPVPVRYLGQRWIETVSVISTGATITAQQFATVFAHATELHVFVIVVSCT